MNLVLLRHDSESQQLYGERRKQLHAYGLGKPQKGKWGTTAQLMERRSISGDPSRVGSGLKAGRMLRRSRACFLKVRQWLYVELGTVSNPEAGRWIPRAYSPTASSMKLHPIPGPISSGLRVPSCQVRGRLCPLFCAPPTVAVTYGLMSRGVSWLQGAEEQSAFSSCWKLSLLQSGTQQLLKVAVVEAGETRSGVKAGDGWTLT